MHFIAKIIKNLDVTRLFPYVINIFWHYVIFFTCSSCSIVLFVHYSIASCVKLVRFNVTCYIRALFQRKSLVSRFTWQTVMIVIDSHSNLSQPQREINDNGFVRCSWIYGFWYIWNISLYRSCKWIVLLCTTMYVWALFWKMYDVIID